MHFAFNEKREFTTADILNGIEQIIPLSQIDPERTKTIAGLGIVWSCTFSVIKFREKKLYEFELSLFSLFC